MTIYLTLVGGTCLAAAAVLLALRLRVRFFGATATGCVVGHEARIFDDSTAHHPVVMFIDAEGKERRFTSVAGGGWPRPAPGAAVQVRYLPVDPGRAYIDSFLHMWAAPLAFAVLGIAGLLAGGWR